MRLYDVFKQKNGRKEFLLRVAAVAIDFVTPNLPPLPEGERYLQPEPVTDPASYRAAIEEFEAIASRERETYRGIVARETAVNLRRELAEMERQESNP